VPLGFYHCLIPLQAVSGMLVRSLIYVRQNGRQKEFIRLTKFPALGGGSKYYMNSRHKGILFANSVEIYLLGLDRHGPFNCTLMAMQRSSGAHTGILRGRIMTYNADTPITTGFSLIYIEDQTDVRAHLKNLGVFHQSNSKFDSFAVAAFNMRQ
jgi:hypothetical protein